MKSVRVVLEWTRTIAHSNKVLDGAHKVFALHISDAGPYEWESEGYDRKVLG